MKKFLFLACFIFSSSLCFSQDQDAKNYLTNVLPRHFSDKNIKNNSVIDCIGLPYPSPCGNFISNNSFLPNASYDPLNPTHWENPFASFVPKWYPAQGDAFINDYWSEIFYNTQIFAPPPAQGYAALGCGYQSLLGNYSEGIVQKIPPLVTGHKYSMSFFEKYSKHPTVPNGSGGYYIYLLNCSDYDLINRTNSSDPNDYYSFPQIPTNSQLIYCQPAISVESWAQKSASFLANSNFDMIWIVARNTQSQIEETCLIDFSLPEILDMTNFSAGTSPSTPYPINCLVDIGPSIPNDCLFTNGILNWHGPNGQVIQAIGNQHIQIDASSSNNVGAWTLQIDIIGQGTTPGTCSSPVSASVNINSCDRIDSYWPKVYSTSDGPFLLSKLSNGGVLSSFSFVYLDYPQFNHLGSPLISNSTYNSVRNPVINYSSDGLSSWYLSSANSDFKAGLCLQSGLMQIFEIAANQPNTSSFYNINNGTIVNPPISSLLNEELIAELNDGKLVSRVAGGLKLYDLQGSSTTWPVQFGSILFNRNLSNFIVLGLTSATIYQYNGSSIQQTNTHTFTTNQNFIHIDNSNNLYMLENGVVKKYSFVTNTVSPLQIGNFNNFNLQSINNNSTETGGSLLVNGISNNFLYLVDVENLSFKKMPYSGGISSFNNYLISNDDIYLNGNNSRPAQISNQNIPYFESISTFVSKFKVGLDFFDRQEITKLNSALDIKNVLGINVFPNPTQNNITISMDSKGVFDELDNKVIIRNKNGNIIQVVSKYTLNSRINIAALSSGLYWVSYFVDEKLIDSKPFYKL